jgi:nucleoside-diphosphate-sugar epimerase
LKVLVTGGSGFVGSHVAERLQAGGHELRLLLRASSKLDYLQDVEFERVDGDIRDASSLPAALEGVEAVVHCAGITSARTYAEYEAINARGTADLVHAARDAGVQRFLFASSLAAQGPSPDGHPQPPEPSLPVSSYGRTKLAAEYAVRAERQRLNVSILRLPVVYGPRDRGLLPFYVMAKFGVLPLYGNGDHQISWIHAWDAADAMALALEKSEKSGSVYTVNDGAPHTWRELAAALGDAFGSNLRLLEVPHALYNAAAIGADLIAGITKKPLPLTAEKVVEMKQRYWIGDNATIREQLGWEPRIDYRDGIAVTLAWYRENGWLKLF